MSHEFLVCSLLDKFLDVYTSFIIYNRLPNFSDLSYFFFFFGRIVHVTLDYIHQQFFFYSWSIMNFSSTFKYYEQITKSIRDCNIFYKLENWCQRCSNTRSLLSEGYEWNFNSPSLWSYCKFFFYRYFFTKFYQSDKFFLSLLFDFIFTVIFENLLLYEEMLILPRSLKN